MTADERIRELIARAGSPVMVVKSGERNRLSVRFKKLDDLACEKLKEKKYTRKSSALIDVLCDEVEKMDDQITDMANTIDRMEAALNNVIIERDQLLSDLRHEIRKHGSCDFCQNVPFHAADCNGCTMDNDRWTWRGVPDKEE